MEEIAKEIIVSRECYVCDNHSTELGVLDSLINSTLQLCKGQFKEPELVKIIISRYEQWKLDERTKTIQGFKVKNIKAINYK